MAKISGNTKSSKQNMSCNGIIHLLLRDQREGASVVFFERFMNQFHVELRACPCTQINTEIFYKNILFSSSQSSVLLLWYFRWHLFITNIIRKNNLARKSDFVNFYAENRKLTLSVTLLSSQNTTQGVGHSRFGRKQYCRRYQM